MSTSGYVQCAFAYLPTCRGSPAETDEVAILWWFYVLRLSKALSNLHLVHYLLPTPCKSVSNAGKVCLSSESLCLENYAPIR